MSATRLGWLTTALLAWTATSIHAQAPDRRVLSDVVYGHKDGMAMVYDVTVPANANGAGVIFVISGGFLYTLEQQAQIAPVAEPLVDAGFTIFHLRHLSTPRYLAPEIYEAIRLGSDHILEHAPEFGVDPSGVGVMGMSTGGLLTLLIAMDVPQDVGSTAGGRVAAAVAYMPMVDMRDAVGNVRATPSLGFDPELTPSLSPVEFVSADDPPTLFIHGERDDVVPLDPNSRRLQPMLAAAGVRTDLIVIDAGHELFSGADKERADRAALAWFEDYLLR